MGFAEASLILLFWASLWIVIAALGALVFVAHDIATDASPDGTVGPVEFIVALAIFVALFPAYAFLGVAGWFWDLRVFDPLRKLFRSFLTYTKLGQFIYSFYLESHLEKSNPRSEVCQKILDDEKLSGKLKSARLKRAIEKCSGHKGGSK